MPAAMMQFTVDAQWQIIAWSDAIATVSGFDSDDVLKRSFLDLLAMEDRERVQQVLEQARSSKDFLHGVALTLHSKSGVPIQLVLQISSSSNEESNEETSTAGAVITASHAPNSTSCGDSHGKMQVGVNSEWKITSWNEASEAISGFSSEEMIGLLFLDLVVDYEREDVLEVLHLVHESQEFVVGFSFTLYSKSGVSIKMQLDISPCIGEDESTTDVLITGVITPQSHLNVLEMAKVAGNILECAETHKKRQVGKRLAASSVSMSACTSMDDIPLITATTTASTTMDDLPCFKSAATVASSMEDRPPLGLLDLSVHEPR